MSERITNNKNTIMMYAASAIIPMAIMTIMFVINEISPFGDQRIIVVDLFAQFYPFIVEFWHRVNDGNSLLWSWSGGGRDYIADFAYYLASPFNLIATLFPRNMLREVLMVAIILRVGFAGLFMAMYLKYITKRNDIALPAFAALYALCAYSLGYYFVIIWMDTFAMLPLVMLGVHKLVTEGKYMLYIVSLALAVFFNFYIGLFVCIFTAILFFVLCFTNKLNKQQFLQKLGAIALCSAVALGLIAFLLIPTFSTLMLTYRTDAAMPAFRLRVPWSDLLGNFTAFNARVNEHSGSVPNLYSGMISLMLLPLFAMSKKINLRERISYTAVLAFMTASSTISTLYFMWHGFSPAHGLTGRFTFLISFVLVAIAYRAYLLLNDDGITKNNLIAMAIGAGAFLVFAIIGRQENAHIFGSAIFAAIFLVIFYVEMGGKIRKIAKFALVAVICVELGLVAHHTLVTMGNSGESAAFPWAYDQTQELLAMREMPENDFFRTEFTRRWSANDASLYGYVGLNYFSTLKNAANSNFFGGLGLQAWDGGNRVAYHEASPLTNAFIAMRYIMNRSGFIADDNVFWDRIGDAGSGTLLRNNRHLPLGFMVNPEVAGYVGERVRLFESQNDLFRRATGLEGDLFTYIDFYSHEHTNFDMNEHSPGQQDWRFTRHYGQTEVLFRFNFIMPRGGEVYASIRMEGTTEIRLIGNGSNIGNINSYHRMRHLIRVGTFQAGDIVSFESVSSITNASGQAQTFVAVLDRELFEEGFAILSAETLDINYFSDTRVVGNITTQNGGLLYTSIPYTNGRWRVYVNGERRDIVLIDGAMTAVMLEPGTHEVEFRYRNSDFILGAGIGVVCLAILVAMIVLSKIKWRHMEFLFFEIKQPEVVVARKFQRNKKGK